MESDPGRAASVTRSPVAPVTWFSDSGGMRSRVANKATGSAQHQLQESPALITRGTIAAVRLSITDAADQSAALFDFHVSVKNKNIRPISDRPFCFSATGPVNPGTQTAMRIF